jgi:hypothetical protein
MLSGFGGIYSSDKEHRPDNICLPSEPPLFSSLSRNVLHLFDHLKFWSSKYYARYGDQLIDISSATKGTSSTVPHGATQQIFPYPGTAYRSYISIFHGIDTEYDVNKAVKKLFAMVKLPKTINRCILVNKQWD